MRRYDALVIGGGISGVSIGYEMAAHRRVGLLEMEATLAYHTSGRSVATFIVSYGGPVIRALTAGARRFFTDPPDVMASPLLSPLGVLWVGRPDEAAHIQARYDAVHELVPDARVVSPQEVAALNPALRPDYAGVSLYEPGAARIDVHALHQGYVRGLRRRGGEVHVSAPVVRLSRQAGVWHVEDAHGEQYEAEVVVNAAGSWVDQVAERAGVAPIGIRPLRRSAFLVTPPPGLVVRTLPLTAPLADTWYFLPQGELVACSPADVTPSEPCDARPDETEIARAIEEINEASILGVRSVVTAWAGLRNFVADRDPVVGWDPAVEGFFWYAGQGGYGMQMAPALSRVGAALAQGQGVPADLAALGLRAEQLTPARLRVPAPPV